MRTLTISAFTLIAACFIVCYSAGPSGIGDDFVVGGHDSGDCCQYDSTGFCGHYYGTCPDNTNMNFCQKSYGDGRCSHEHTGLKPCDVDGCANRDKFNEFCNFGDPP